jgi:hypothetical protein
MVSNAFSIWLFYDIDTISGRNGKSISGLNEIAANSNNVGLRKI